MSIALERLEAAVAEYDRDEDDEFVDIPRLSAAIARLQAKQARSAASAAKRGEHLLAGRSAVSWVAHECQLSKTAAADRLCVGSQLPKLPAVAIALETGSVGFQAASVLCHLNERFEQVDATIEEEEWIAHAREWSLKDLMAEAAKTWHAVDPTGFDLKVEEAHERRQLYISECGDMYRIDGWLELSAGALVKAAIDALARPLGADDPRKPKHRRADALTELANHALDSGVLPKRHGGRPHIAVHTTIEGLKNELGASASELSDGTPISSQTVQRLACDGILHRVLKADSMIIDVGRAHRTAQPAQWRGLKARHRSCAWPGCDRPLSWTSAHHLDFWEHGGRGDLRRMLPLCFHHHRLVHEGGYNVVAVGDRFDFIAPDRPVMIRRRWGEYRSRAA
jgi:hypothetical protein